MVTTMDAFDPMTFQQLHTVSTAIQQSRKSNVDSSHVDISRMRSVPSPSSFTFPSTRAGESVMKQSTPPLPPPIALLSGRQHEDPAVLRLHAALARSSGGSTSREPLADVSRPESPSTQTPYPATSPKNSLSVGYDDDLMSSDFSTPIGASPSSFSRKKRSYAGSFQYSPTLVDSEEDNDGAQIVVPEFCAVNDCPLPITSFPRVGREHARRQNEAQQDKWEMVESDMLSDMSHNSGFSHDPPFTLIHECRKGTDISCVGARGVSAIPPTSVDVVVSVKETIEEADVAQSQPNDDDVIGVTAEGELIYKRDIVSQKCGNDGNDAENEKENEGYGKFYYQHHEDTPVYDGAGTFFYTPETNVFATALSRSFLQAEEGQQQEEEREGRRDTASVMMDPTITPPPVRPLWGRGTGSGGCSKRGNKPVGPVWRTEDLEWCALLLQYGTRENAEEWEYREVLSAVDGLREAQRRFPAEALELRLQQEESYDKPPFILRW